MITDTIKELETTRAKLASLERQVASELTSELSTLPTRYGFDSVEDFIRAVKDAAGSGGGKRLGRKPGPMTAKSASKSGPAKKRTRAVITDETRAEVKKMVGAGKTGNEIGKALGISLPSVQNIKKALGLVQKR